MVSNYSLRLFSSNCCGFLNLVAHLMFKFLKFNSVMVDHPYLQGIDSNGDETGNRTRD